MAKPRSQLLRKLHAMGIVTKQGRTHIKVYAPLGIVVMSLSPGDTRSLQNTLSDLRRAGIQIRREDVN